MRRLGVISLVMVIGFLFQTNSASSQIELNSNNDVRIGPTWLGFSKDLNVNGETHFSCYPAWGGINIENWNNFWWYQMPTITPQWGNFAALGKWNKPFYLTRAYYDVYNYEWQYSDSSIKTNVSNLNNDNSLTTLNNLNPVKYQVKDSYYDSIGNDSISVVKEEEKNRERYGFVAQQLENVKSSLVKVNENGRYMVNNNGLLPILTSAIQKQQEIIQNMQTQIDSLQNQVNQCCGTSLD